MARLIARLEGPLLAFLVCGTLAAAVSWFARMILSLWMPFGTAVMVAYAIGMLAGFLLYRRYVWTASDRSLMGQIIAFIAVNIAVAVLVLVTALGLVALGEFIAGRSPIIEALAHGAAIAVGAAANYIAHREITFRVKPRTNPTS
ncbi:GtrA family protein [Taklimakanibacter lacteus]|uniref:GtrA family protein n=1 Tax=Taklimakanibacter lacteus TaxID=2268456 RepID=UPI000E669E4A